LEIITELASGMLEAVYNLYWNSTFRNNPPPPHLRSQQPNFLASFPLLTVVNRKPTWSFINSLVIEIFEIDQKYGFPFL
jgi:hypothetical protein